MFSELSYCQQRYFASKSQKTTRAVFDRTIKRLQKCHAAASAEVSVYEYLKENVRVSCVVLYAPKDVFRRTQKL